MYGEGRGGRGGLYFAIYQGGDPRISACAAICQKAFSRNRGRWEWRKSALTLIFWNLISIPTALTPQFDMGGAAATLGAARIIAETAPGGVEVHFIIAACENMVAGR